MRREHFTLSATDVDWVETGGTPRKPSVSIDFTGPVGDLHGRLTGPDGEPLAAGETDVALRLQGPIGAETEGVVSVTNRVTGEFVIELNESAESVLRFIRAARSYGDRASDDEDGRYSVEISLAGEPFVFYEKRTFLVYDESGSLLRQHSLIPSGVEL